MKGDSNRFLARSEGSGVKNDCGGAANIGLLGFVRKGENDLPVPFCKTRRYVMAERCEKTPGVRLNRCFI